MAWIFNCSSLDFVWSLSIVSWPRPKQASVFIVRLLFFEAVSQPAVQPAMKGHMGSQRGSDIWFQYRKWNGRMKNSNIRQSAYLITIELRMKIQTEEKWTLAQVNAVLNVLCITHDLIKNSENDFYALFNYIMYLFMKSDEVFPWTNDWGTAGKHLLLFLFQAFDSFLSSAFAHRIVCERTGLSVERCF